MYAKCYVLIVVYTMLFVSLSAYCRQSSNNKNYTCDGYMFRQLSASPVTRKQILLTTISDCKETSIQENEKGLIFPNLQTLKISCGVIKEISENAFTNLNQLVELDLGSNSLSSIPNNMLKPLIELKILRLNANKFEVLTNEMFSSASMSLRKLVLSYNNISVLMPKTFSKLLKLEELFLDNNALGPLTTGVFSRMPYILLIDLSHNSIKYLYTSFSNNRELKYLYISHNAITDLPSRVFHNTHLEVIDLSNNELEAVYEDSFKWIYLQELYLQNNKIVLFEVTGESISSTPLKHLDLRNNRLVFLKDSFIKKATALVMLKVDNNPWDCACYNKIVALRNDLGLQVSNEHRRGMKSMCVIGDNNNCVIERSTLQSYYKMFLTEHDV